MRLAKSRSGCRVNGSSASLYTHIRIHEGSCHALPRCRQHCEVLEPGLVTLIHVMTLTDMDRLTASCARGLLDGSLPRAESTLWCACDTSHLHAPAFNIIWSLAFAQAGSISASFSVSFGHNICAFREKCRALELLESAHSLLLLSACVPSFFPFPEVVSQDRRTLSVDPGRGISCLLY